MSEQPIRRKMRFEDATDINLEAELARHMGASNWRLVSQLAQESSSHASAIYLVGGIVRDLLLGIESLDIDLVMDGEAIPFAKALKKKYGGALEMHAPFGTAKWILDADKLGGKLDLDPSELAGHLDLISARQEKYPQAGDLPKVRFADLKADTQRRDFTINTLAINLISEGGLKLIDDWGGIEDLRQGILRVLHAQSFRDDATRIQRIFRFRQRFAFEIDSETSVSLTESLDYLEGISGERIRHELDLILQEQQPAQILQALDDVGALAKIHPMLNFPANVEKSWQKLEARKLGPEWDMEQYPHPWLKFCLWLMQLEGEAGQLEQLLQRLVLERKLSLAILQAHKAISEKDNWPGEKVSEIVFHLDEMQALARAAFFLSIEDERLATLAQDYASKYRHIQVRTTGHDLKAMGLKEGPIFAEILKQLRAAWLDDEIASEAEEKSLLEQLLRTKGIENGS